MKTRPEDRAAWREVLNATPAKDWTNWMSRALELLFDVEELQSILQANKAVPRDRFNLERGTLILVPRLGVLRIQDRIEGVPEFGGDPVPWERYAVTASVIESVLTETRL